MQPHQPGAVLAGHHFPVVGVALGAHAAGHLLRSAPYLLRSATYLLLLPLPPGKSATAATAATAVDIVGVFCSTSVVFAVLRSTD